MSAIFVLFSFVGFVFVRVSPDVSVTSGREKGCFDCQVCDCSARTHLEAFRVSVELLNSITIPIGYQCEMPPVEPIRVEACDVAVDYPVCRYQVPPEKYSRGLYNIWWRTPPSELWGRRELVELILKSIYLYRKRFPYDEIYVGDLTAPLSNHLTHKDGLSADIYLLRWMEWIQVKDGKYVDNMSWRSPSSRCLAREKVFHLAKSFYICAGGRVQIFYNDPVIINRVSKWFYINGYSSPFAIPMISHNNTHHDHFHIRIPPE